MSAAVTVANPAAAIAAAAATPAPAPASTALASASASSDVKAKAAPPAPRTASGREISANPPPLPPFEFSSVKAGTKEGQVVIDGQDFVPYFAIGSMVNATSLNLRDIFAYRSVPGELKGYELVFRGLNGMGSVDAKAGASLHGVLHYLTPKDMDALDKIEASYVRLHVDIHLYDGNVVKGWVYQMDAKKFPALTQGVHNPPSERYIDIITRGAKYHGVAPAFIEWLSKLTVVPRRAPKDFKRVPDPDGVLSGPNAKPVTCAQLKAMDGNDGRPLGVCINRKVMIFDGDLKTVQGQSTYNWAKGRLSGKDNTVGLSHTLYEPMYPIVNRYCDMSEEQRAWCEDFYSNNWTGMWKAIGYLSDMPADA